MSPEEKRRQRAAAKRRQAKRQPRRQVQRLHPNATHEALEFPRKWINEDFGMEPVAEALSPTYFKMPEMEGGDCLTRHYMASRLLLEMGYPTILTFGVLEARVGLGPHDVITYYHLPTRRFHWEPKRPMGGHVWLSHAGPAGAHLLDLTVGNWPKATAQYHKIDGLPPVTWNVRLPQYWWLAALPSWMQLGDESEIPALEHFPLSGVFYGMSTVLHQPMMEEHAESFEALEKEYGTLRDRLWRTVESAQRAWRGKHLPKDLAA